MIKIFGVRPWAVVVGLLTVVSAGLGAGLALRPPSTPKPCLDEMAIMCSGATTCDYSEQTMKVSKIENTCHLIECTCPRRP